MNQAQLGYIKEMLSRLPRVDEFYKQKFKGINLEAIQSQADFETLPFTDKGDLRDAYP